MQHRTRCKWPIWTPRSQRALNNNIYCAPLPWNIWRVVQKIRRTYNVTSSIMIPPYIRWTEKKFNVVRSLANSSHIAPIPLRRRKSWIGWHCSICEIQSKMARLLPVLRELKSVMWNGKNRFLICSFSSMEANEAMQSAMYHSDCADYIFHNMATSVAFETIIRFVLCAGQKTTVIWVSRANACMIWVMEEIIAEWKAYHEKVDNNMNRKSDTSQYSLWTRQAWKSRFSLVFVTSYPRRRCFVQVEQKRKV